MKFIIGISFLIFHSARGDHPAVQNIINGADARPGEFPYMAALMRYNQDFYCGGVLVSDQHVLTAAHCATSVPTNELTVLLGTNDLLSGGQYFDVSEKVISDDYSAEYKVIGIAVLTLSKKVELSNFLSKIELPQKDLADGTTATLTGYGYRMKDLENGYMSQILQKLPVNIINQEICVQQLIEFERIQPQQLCGYTAWNYGPCYGDSGSPLVHNNTLIGLALSVHPDCAEGYPDSYARITSYLTLIRQTISK